MPSVTHAPDLLRASKEYCRKQARGNVRGFSFASFALPIKKKEAVCSVHSFCRYADERIRSIPKEDFRAVLKELESEYHAILNGRQTAPLFCAAFADTVQRYRIEKEPFLDLFKALACDAGPVRVATWPELHDYCYHAAAAPALVLARIFEIADDRFLDHAIDLGIAIRLSTLLRDIGDDYPHGRVYLPENEMAEFGIDETDLAMGRMSSNFKEFMQFQVQRARGYFLSAEEGIPSLRDDGSQYTAWMLHMMYSGLLDEIERRHFDVFSRRIQTGFLRKLAIASSAYRAYVRNRRKGFSLSA